MTNLNTIDFIRFVGPTQTLTDGGRVLEVSGFSGSGDVVGPASSVDDRIAVFDGTTGKLIADGGITIAGLIAMMGGGGGNSVTTTLAFGVDWTDKAQTVVTGQTWVTSTSEIVAQVKTPSGVDPDEIRLLDFKPVISDLVAGVGFTVTLYSEPEAKGNYEVMCIGV